MPLFKPSALPRNPSFSSGPCAKRPGWDVTALPTDTCGRSHRAKIARERLQRVVDESRALLELPDDYLIGIMPGSDTGAFESAMWSLLGARPVDVFAWEAFGKDWAEDVISELKIANSRSFTAPFGELPDFSQADFSHDVVFTWNGTTSGVRVPNGDWIDDKREGLTLCDATSAVFMMPLPWQKLDVVTYSWQKALGGEGAHGMLILSPRAVARLESYTPSWPIPKIFRLTKKGELIRPIFEGVFINTPSMICVEDVLDAMAWARSLGGLNATIARTESNFAALSAWVARTPWVDFLASNPAQRSPSSVCLKIVDAGFQRIDKDAQAAFCKKFVSLLEKEGAAYDINGYRSAPPGLRIWCGTTIEKADIETLTLWLDWAWESMKASLAQAA